MAAGAHIRWRARLLKHANFTGVIDAGGVEDKPE